MVYVDSLTAVSKDGYRFTGGNGAPAIVDTFRATLRKVSALPCDVLISTHPSATDMDQKLRARNEGSLAPGAPGDPFVDAGACRSLAERSMRALDERVQAEGRP
jgi:metallo-beta-lactamase class B